MVDLPDRIRPLFVSAGWHSDRRVPVSLEVPADHPAAAILGAFGGLTVTRPEDAEGEECALDDLTFRELSPDPSILDVWAKLLGTRLVGIADIHVGHGEWYIASDGRVFGRSCVHDAFWLAGESFEEAAERSLFGRRVRPLLRPGQESVTLYGIEFDAESTGLYRYR